MQLRRVITGLVLGATVLCSGVLAAPAQAALPAGVPNWTVSRSHFGPYKLNTTLGEVAKKSHVDYRKLLRPAVAGWGKVANGTRCMDALKLPLLTKPGNDPYGANSGLYMVVQPPCVKRAMSLSAYEQRYKPYTRSRVLGYAAEQRTRTGIVPDGLGRVLLPHTAKIAIGSTYQQVLQAYRGQLRDHTGLDTFNGRTSRSGYVSVYSRVKHNGKLTAVPAYSFYVAGGSVIELSIGRDLFVG